MEEQKFEIFKEVFIGFFNEKLGPSTRMLKSLENIKDYDTLELFFENYIDSINGMVGNHLDDEIDSLNEEIHDLNRVIYNLEDELENYKPFNTYHGEMNYENFLKHQHKFDPWEFKELLENKK